MSKRASGRGHNVTIDYEVSEWDANQSPLRERRRSNSVDLLEELRRSKKVHAPTQTIPARYSEHHSTHGSVVTVPNDAPNPTFARSYRYGKEALRHECHEWRRRDDAHTSRGIQCELKPAQRHEVIQCRPSTREMNIQTHRPVPDNQVAVKAASKDRGVQAMQNVNDNYDELIALIKSLNIGAVRSDGGGGNLQQIVSSLAELLALLRTVHQTTEGVDAKETEILHAMRGFSMVRNEDGSGFSEDALIKVAGLLDEIHSIVKMVAKVNDTDKIQVLIGELNRLISSMRSDYDSILIAIKAVSEQKSGDTEGYFIKIIAYLKEILEMLDENDEEEEISTRQLYDGRCRCAEIGQAANAVCKGMGAMMPGLCQRCINDFKGRTFVQSLNLPMALSADIVNVIGKTIECIESDDDFNLKFLIEEIRKMVGNKWEARTYQISYEAMFHLALLWRSAKSCLVLVKLIELSMMVRGMKSQEHRYRLPDYVQKAIQLRDVRILQALFDSLNDQERIMVLNTPLVRNDTRHFPLFTAARVGDVEIFRFFVDNGAALDVRETDRTILHEIALISSKKTESPKLKEWNKVLVSMLSVVYERSGVWWERQLLHAAWSGSTEASKLNALNYLCSVPDQEGRNALQFAARVATPQIIRKMVCNPPYEFVPDPLQFGHDNGEKGYTVDQIESKLAGKNSVLESMLLRDPMEGAGVMSVEPFKSMIDDKWNRYRIFYGLWFVCYLCYMILYTWCALDRPLESQSLADMFATSRDQARVVGEIIVILLLPLFFYGEIRDIFRMGFVVPRPWLRTGLFRILNFVFILLTILVVVMRLTRNPREDIVLSLALLVGWLMALEFLGAWKTIGMFAHIMHKVIAIDVALRFFLVWLIALLGTSTATFVAYQLSAQQGVLPDFPISNASFWYTPLALTKVSLALLHTDYVTEAADAPFGVVLFVIFAILFNFVLFSLAIGMMADTYARTRQTLNTSWIWVKANFALMMDRRLPNFLCISYVENKGQGFAALASTKLRYLTRSIKRRVNDGTVVEVREHVVLVAKEDRPKVVAVTGKDMEILSSVLKHSPRD